MEVTSDWDAFFRFNTNYFSGLKNKCGQIIKLKTNADAELASPTTGTMKTRRDIMNFMANNNGNLLHQRKRKTSVKKLKVVKWATVGYIFLKCLIEFNVSC